MAKNKYYYGVANKENGKLLLDCGRLPFFYRKKVAKECADSFNNYCVIRVDISKIEKAILSGKVNKKDKL